MDLFDPNLIPNILYNLPLSDILNVCTALLPYQTICKDQRLWQNLLYRDYGTFSYIISQSSPKSYYDLYQRFYKSPFFKSFDFRTIYKTVYTMLGKVVFLDSNQNSKMFPLLVFSKGWKNKLTIGIKIPIPNRFDIYNQLIENGQDVYLNTSDRYYGKGEITGYDGLEAFLPMRIKNKQLAFLCGYN